MKVELEKSFVIEAAVADCWRLLSDIPRVTTCMPGASITQVIDASHFAGRVMVNIGPMRLQFAGELELVMIDASARKLVLMATGTDKSGSSATMKLTTILVDKKKSGNFFARAGRDHRKWATCTIWIANDSSRIGCHFVSVCGSV